MTRLRDLSIRHKLTLAIVVTSTIALLLACLAFIGYARHAAYERLAENLVATAEITAENSAAALTFDDPESAERTLHSLVAQPEIRVAAIYDSGGRLFASYQRADHTRSREALPAQPPPEGARFGEEWLDVVLPIELAGETAGSVYIRSTLENIDRQQWLFVQVAVMVVLLAALLAWVLATRLQGLIAGPILRLSRVMQRVAAEKNYLIRAGSAGHDEVGRLIEGFNGMLDQIQERDLALQESRHLLEQRVQERTRELQLEVAERRQAEHALRRSEERFSSAFEHASSGMALLTTNGQFLKVNRALCELLGYTPEALLERTFRDITHPDDLQTSIELQQQLRAGIENSVRFEKRYVHRDGATIWAMTAVSIVRDSDGQPQYFIAQVQDITQRRHAEARLEESHKQLLEASRQSGMAEVATNVLHNVGNVLNSVNVSAGLVIERLRKAPSAGLDRVVALLRERRGDLARFIAEDERGRHLPDYLEQLAAELRAHHQQQAAELESLRTNIDHIKEIVAMQQSYSKVMGNRETVDVRELVEDSLRMNEGALARHGVAVERDYDDVPPVSVEKHKVLQILVNLVRNAKYACDESGRTDKRIRLQVRGEAGRIRVAVIDNGTGIAPENLTRIFSHGFTTRRGGHGYGLHSGALAAKDLGGSLTAHSDGPGRGASFVLDLPAPADGGPP